MALSIINAIKAQDPPGRFLEIDSIGTWIEVEDEKAIEKTCQTFRKNYDNNKKVPISPKPKDAASFNFFNHVSSISVKEKPNNANLFASVDLANKFKERQNIHSTVARKQQQIDLSSYDKFILSNLQKYYSNKQQSLSIDSKVHQSLCRFHEMPSNRNTLSHPLYMESEVVECNNENMTMSIMNPSHGNTINNIGFLTASSSTQSGNAMFREEIEASTCVTESNICVQEDDELDDIFMAIMDQNDERAISI